MEKTNSWKKSSIFIANVTFEPECRNNWHIHHSTKNGGQIVIFWSDWRKNEYENFYR